ncbi:hypothetical protein AJ79_02603 [Helicocarpus griseus UAMH5409]|uniref:Major facilitator superfamily (MFS) profile domain-containing protein n=1 Tax=Helicocarpus griseus UAMH5409 TaxID=1447875 RepID=A0A2B7Y311_9EURO|nr:hypothetical protein AJ79_02603 [Helicocarpus griseus UAMH5409]
MLNEKSSDSPDAEGVGEIINFGGIDERKVLRKMDLRLIPIMTLLYLLCFLDRGNIGNAKIEGLTEDLPLTGSQYNICLTVFFFPYALFELPSNLVLAKLKPSIWLPTIMVGWGLVMTLMGIVRNYHGLLTARVFLGLSESGLYPGVAFYLTKWYCRHEAQLRQALFFSAASVAGAFSGLLAFAIAKMDGVGSLDGWRWIFILEGILTVVVALFAFFITHDYPETATFLTEKERAWVIHRLKYQYSDTAVKQEKFQWRYVKETFLDWQVYLAILTFYGIVCPLYGVSFFLPTIIRDLGYTSSTAQLLTIPVYIIAAILAIGSALLSDRQGKRSPLLLFHMVCIIIGYIIVIAATGRGVPGVVYFGTFVIVAGIYPALPGNITWLSNNLAPDHKRAAGIAIHVGIGNLSGAMASNFYRTRDGPNYYLGHGLELGFACLGLLSVVIQRTCYKSINEKREVQAGEHNYTPDELSKMGDKAPTFKYML